MSIDGGEHGWKEAGCGVEVLIHHPQFNLSTLNLPLFFPHNFLLSRGNKNAFVERLLSYVGGWLRVFVDWWRVVVFELGFWIPCHSTNTARTIITFQRLNPCLKRLLLKSICLQGLYQARVPENMLKGLQVGLYVLGSIIEAVVGELLSFMI